MRETISDCLTDVLDQIRSIHRLQREMPKGQVLKNLRLRLRFDLWVHELQLIARQQLEWSVCLRAHANPIDARRRRSRAVGLYDDLESLGMERGCQRLVDLQERFAPCADDIRLRGRTILARPGLSDALRQRDRRNEFSTIGTDPHKIRVAELADGIDSIRLVSRPQVAAGKAAEHRGPPGVNAFPLQGIENLLDRVHVSACTGWDL